MDFLLIGFGVFWLGSSIWLSAMGYGEFWVQATLLQ
jgi:hypothetical protein